MTDHPTTDRPRTGQPSSGQAGSGHPGSGPDPVGPTPLIVSQHVAAPADTVFDFLVEPDKMLRWMGTAVDITPEAGGTFWMDVNGTDIASGLYQEVIRPERVVFTFGWEGSPNVPAGSTTVTIALEPMADGTTTVHLRHDGLPKGPADDHRHGWTHYLGRLGEAVDRAGQAGDPG